MFSRLSPFWYYSTYYYYYYYYYSRNVSATWDVASGDLLTRCWKQLTWPACVQFSLPASNNYNNNEVIYTAKIRQGYKCAFSRGKFSMYLKICPVTCPVNIAQLADCSTQRDRWPGNSGRRSTSSFVECFLAVLYLVVLVKKHSGNLFFWGGILGFLPCFVFKHRCKAMASSVTSALEFWGHFICLMWFMAAHEAAKF